MHIRKYSLCVIVVFQTSQDLFKMKLPINIYLQGNDHLLLIDIQNCITSTQSDLHCFWRHSILCSAWTEPMTFVASTMLLSYRNHTYRDLPSYISRDLHLNQLIKIFFFPWPLQQHNSSKATFRYCRVWNWKWECMLTQETMNMKHMPRVLWLVFIYIKRVKKRKKKNKKLKFQNGINISYGVLLRGKLLRVKWQCMLSNVESIKVAEEIKEASISLSENSFNAGTREAFSICLLTTDQSRFELFSESSISSVAKIFPNTAMR